MNTRTLVSLSLLGLGLLLGGCSAPEMKGTPFYTGEYQLNVPDADVRRVNLWPLAYYREPALSVLWPVFEHTEEHLAVRPFYSAYGDAKAYWEYNLLWPLIQADTKGRDYRVFPYYWGECSGRDGKPQAYHVLFPFAWHFRDQSFVLFPLGASAKDDWSGGAFTGHDYWLGWPLFHLHTGEAEQAWRAGPVGHYRYAKPASSYAGYPWPLCFSWSGPTSYGAVTPVYAHGWNERNGVRDGWDAIPLLLSWHQWRDGQSDVHALLSLYGRHTEAGNSSWHLVPLCAYDRRDRLLLTPLVGWNKPDDADGKGYWYPFTPLAGVKTGDATGGWVFPLYDRTANPTNGTYQTHFALLGYAEHTRGRWSTSSSENRECSFFPLFSHSAYASTTLDAKSRVERESLVQSDRQLLFHASTSRTTSRAVTNGAPAHASSSTPPPTDSVMTTTTGGLWPVWSTDSWTKTRLDGTPLSASREFALLGFLYDTKHDTAAADATHSALDYARHRVLWRVWHRERRNGDVSLDVFPFITRDAHADGFRKTSFLWRFYRYERSRDGQVAVDLLFLPIVRTP